MDSDLRNIPELLSMSDAFRLAGTQSFALTDPTSGDAYRIDIAIPDGMAPESGWPSLLLLDAGDCFGTGVETMRRMSRRGDATGVTPMVVVGLSPVGDGSHTVRRRRDFTTRRGGQDGSGEGEGGAPGFLAFVANIVLPGVARRLPLDPERRTLFGHSLAGYFVLWAMASRPEAFAAYAAISPSVWWDREGLFGALAQARLRDRRALVVVGEWEEALPPWQRGLPGSAEALARRTSRRMIGNAREVAAHLRAMMREEAVQFALLQHEDHASIIATAMPRVLRLASQGAGRPADNGQ